MSSSVKVSFEGSTGQQLTGRLEMPAGRPRAYALFAHCFTCTKNIRAAVNISRSLAEAGYAVLRFDFTGLGESEGDFADTNFTSNVDDLVSAAAFLSERHQAPRVLVGHSLGGTAMLQAAPRIAGSVAVATIGSPARASHVRKLLAGADQEIEDHGAAEVSLAGRPFRIRKQFLDDLEAQPLPDKLSQLRRALLIMHAPGDDIVSIDNASEIFTNALHPKSFVSLDTADHLLSGEKDSHYAGMVLAAWASRYLPQTAEDDSADVPEGEVRAVTRDTFRTEINAGGHRLVADEPASVGGTNLGPTPYGLLAAALASCTSMTLRMYATHKKIQLDEVDVRVTNQRVHARDCDDCDSTEGYVHRFERELHLSGELTDAQRQRMLEIADRCPVHKTLEHEIQIRTRAG